MTCVACVLCTVQAYTSFYKLSHNSETTSKNDKNALYSQTVFSVFYWFTSIFSKNTTSLQKRMLEEKLTFYFTL